jgi:hypothetical protein
MDECIISVGIAPSKVRRIGSFVVIGGTASGYTDSIWCGSNLELAGLIKHAIGARVEKHRCTPDLEYQGTCVACFEKVVLSGTPRALLAENTNKLSRGGERFPQSCASPKHLASPPPPKNQGDLLAL